MWSGGRYVDALSAVQSELRSVATPSLSLQRDLAELLFLNGRVNKAIDAQKAAVSRHPLPSDLVRLAEYQRYRGRWRDANTSLKRALGQVRLLAEYNALTEREWIAIGRIYELQGTDAKIVLAHYRDLQSQYNSLEAHIAVGGLGLATYAYDLAAREYASALEIDAHNQNALTGLLTCFHESGDPRAEEIAARLSEINPNHPQALTIAARRHLDLGKLDAAEEELNRVLETNPVHLEALALKASVHFLRPNAIQHDASQLDATRARVLDFNPRYAEFDRIVGEIAARHYRFEEAVAFLHAAFELDDEDPRIRLDLAVNLLRLGRDEEARHHLASAFTTDPYNVHAFNLLEVADEMDTFTTVGNGLWRLRMPSLEADVLSTGMLALLSQASSHYEALYNVTLSRPVIVQMFRNHDSFMVRSTGLPGNAGHLGICFGGLITMDSSRARPTGAANWRQVLWHEFVHVITLQKTKNRMPRWLSEGISVFEETRLDPAWGQRLDPDFRGVLASGYPALADLESYFARPGSATELMFGYFAAGEFVAFYVDAYGFDALVRSRNSIRDGHTAATALVSAAGAAADDIDTGFGEHLRRRCETLRNLPAAADDASTDGPYSEAIRAGDRAVEEGDTQSAAEAYRKAFSLFPDTRGEDGPLRRLARLLATDSATASTDSLIAVLTQIVSTTSTAWQEARQLASLFAARDDWSSAGEVIEHAFAVAPFHAGVLAERARYAWKSGRLSDAATDYHRLVTVDPARQTEYRLDLVQVLREMDDIAGARREVVALLELTPHYWKAQSLLLELSETAP